MQIVKALVILVFVVTISWVGWVMFYEGMYLRTLREQNENNAVRILKAIHNSQVKSKENTGKYLSLQELPKDDVINSDVIKGEYSGYQFKIKVEEGKYSVNAIPIKDKNAGVSFYVDETGTVRFSSGNIIAGANDPPSNLQNIVK